MARKTQSPAKQTPTEEVKQGKYWCHPDADWGGFINVRLEDEAKSEFQAWMEKWDEQMFRFMDDLMGEGMKIGLSWDKLNACAIVTFTGAINGDYKTRYVMTTREATWWRAVGLALWKHKVYLDEDWGNYLPRTSKSSSWG